MKLKNCRKILFFSVLGLSFCFFAFKGFEGTPVASIPDTGLGYSPCYMPNTSFQSGEELTYKIYWNWNFVWYSAGEMTFKVIDEDDQWRYSVVGTTYPKHDWFFRVRDYYDTWVQKETMLPIMGIRQIEEGKYRLYDYLTYDQSRKKVYNERGKSIDKIKEKKTYKIEPCMHDIVSILYHTRNVDYSKMKVGDAFPIKIFMDKEMWPLKVRYNGREPGKEVRGLGKYNTQRFSPEVIPGRVFPDGATINIWVTDDANRLPLIIESPLAVGSVKAVLTKHKGLRWPIKSKI